MTYRLAANAALNLVAGLSTAVFAFAVPVALAHRLTPAELSVWSIVLQASAYVAPFTLGIQSVMSRVVAVNHCSDSTMHQSRLAVDAGLRLLGIAAAAYALIAIVAAMCLHRIYPDLPAAHLSVARWTLLLYCLGQATLIPAAAVAGYFFGLQRNVVVTANVVGGRLATAAVIVALATHLPMPVTAALAALVTAVFSLTLHRQFLRAVRAGAGHRHPADDAQRSNTSAEIFRECLPISVWAIATFFIYGGTSTVASWIDFNGFPAYVMASGAAMLLLGLHSAAFGPFIPHFAVTAERGGPAAATRSLIRASLVSSGISASVVLAFVLFGPAVVAWLVPAAYKAQTVQLLGLLLLGNSVRLIGLPYANALIALGLQGKILWTPVIEAGLTFCASIALGSRLGLAGVAAAMAVGGGASVLVHFLINMRVTAAALPVPRARLAAASVLPVAVAWGIFQLVHSNLLNP